MRKTLLIVSLVLNLAFISGSVVFIYMKGGLPFLKRKLYSSELTGKSLYELKAEIYSSMPQHPDDILFFGNSMVAYCDWAELYQDATIKNRGISGDNIEGLYRRLEGSLRIRPRKIFVMIGPNDLSKGRSVDYVVEGIVKITHKIKTLHPGIKPYVVSLLPNWYRPERPNDSIRKINDRLMESSRDAGFEFIDIHDAFTGEDGQLNPTYSLDGLHLNGKGYLLFKDQMREHIYQDPH
jgi:lysophospholipase L1-like esterase